MNKTVITLILFSVPLCAMPVKELTLSCRAVKAATAAATTAQQVAQCQQVRMALQVAVTLKNPLGTAAGYAGGKALSYAHPFMQKYVGIAMEGHLQTIREMAENLENKINNSWLPMRLEQAQLAALREVMASDVVKEIEVMRFGTYDQVYHALERINTSWQLHEMVPTEEPPIFCPEIIETCRQALNENPSVSITMLDMITTTPSALMGDFQGPSYISQRVIDQVGKLDFTAMGATEYISKLREVINKEEALSLQQKQSLFVRAIHHIIEETMIGRLSKRAAHNTQIKMKLKELMLEMKGILDWQYGSVYLSQKELDAMAEKSFRNMDSYIKTMKGIVQLNEPALEKLVDAVCEIFNSWTDNMQYKKTKRTIAKAVSLADAMGKLK